MIIDTNNKINAERQLSENGFDNNEVILSVEGVSKKFCRDLKRSLFYGVRDIAWDLTGLRTQNNQLRKGEFWAVDNVSLQLRKGEALGLVGKNGSGKSTLLRMIAGLIKPDIGTVEVTGRVAPLIALGAGFNPILTGRENIYANMSILGLSKKEINQRFDDVVEFAEVGEAIDAPVQTYSSGMAARLGFASAIYTEPDILLIDEVLAVGDVRFRIKCVRKLAELRQAGTSFIMVSHNHDALASICDKGIYLLKGKSVLSGTIRSALNKYESDLFSNNEKFNGQLLLKEKPESDSSGADITSITLKDHNDQINGSLISGKPCSAIVNCQAKKHFSNVNINIQVEQMSHEGDKLLFINSPDDGFYFDILPGKNAIKINIPYLVLGPGEYSMRILLRRDKGNYVDRVDSFRFLVKNESNTSYSRVYQQHSWDIYNN
jgi:lipopolysaccharide transport system ATP-binding protein